MNVSLKAKLSRKYIASRGTQRLYMLLEIIAESAAIEKKRLPLNLGFVLDRSGSMSGEKLDYTKQAVRYALDHLTQEDNASITAYDQDVQVIVEAGPVVYKDMIKGLVGQIYPGGSTNLSGGLIRGYRQVMEHKKTGQVNRVLLLTDGLANVGITNPAVLSAKAAAMRNSGIAVTTLGVGADFDEDLLTAVAESSGGSYYYIDSPERIPEIFSKELEELLSVIAQNAQLTFKSSSGVSVSKVWGYRARGDKTLDIALPDLYSSDRKAILLEMEVNPSDIGENQLGTITLGYDDAGRDMERTSVSVDITVCCTENEEYLNLPDEPEVIVQLELSKAAEDRDNAINLADHGDLETASGMIEATINSIKFSLGTVSAEMRPCLAEEIERLSRSVEMLKKGKYDNRARKQMAFESYQSRNNRK